MLEPSWLGLPTSEAGRREGGENTQKRFPCIIPVSLSMNASLSQEDYNLCEVGIRSELALYHKKKVSIQVLFEFQRLQQIC